MEFKMGPFTQLGEGTLGKVYAKSGRASQRPRHARPRSEVGGPTLATHKANSLDYLSIRRPHSPAPSSLAASTAAHSDASAKTYVQKSIDGDLGPPMLGVQNFAYSRNELLYHEEFEEVLYSQVEHPFMATTSSQTGSAPHNLISGTALSDAFNAGAKDSMWKSEKNIAYTPIDHRAAAKAPRLGVRSEEIKA